MYRGKRKLFCIAPLVLLVCLTSGCRGTAVGEPSVQEVMTETGKGDKAQTEEKKQKGDYVQKETLAEEGPIADRKEIYADDDETSVVTMYLTVRSGNEAENTDHTWTELNSHSNYYYDENDLARYNVDGILQIGDENGPAEGAFGYGETVPNVAVQVRGQTSSRLEQKNYKIRIKKGKGEWRGQRTLALNKHVSDPYRFLNKMAYDLIKKIPQMMSARTQFVHLYVKDETEGGSGAFEDYGLYTQVEQINRTYLENHGLDRRGHLYKINFFEWDAYEAVMKLPDDPEYDVDAFEDYIEIKGDDDHRKLQEVLLKLQDYATPIEEIVEEHFDVENICYWMAFHILYGNIDVGARNAYIYSPLNSEKWYFITWDNDSSLTRNYNKDIGYLDGLSWERGMSQFLGLRLCNRMFRLEKYRDALAKAVEDLKENYINEKILNKKVHAYAQVVKPYLFADPDLKYARINNEEDYDHYMDILASEIEMNYEYFRESLVNPWPFYVDLPEDTDDGLLIKWGVSYDPNGEDVRYNFWLASDYEFQNVIYHEDGVRLPQVTVDRLPPGQYFIRVRARNASGYEQDCFDYYTVNSIGKIYGARSFIVGSNGNILEYEDEE